MFIINLPHDIKEIILDILDVYSIRNFFLTSKTVYLEYSKLIQDFVDHVQKIRKRELEFDKVLVIPKYVADVLCLPDFMQTPENNYLYLDKCFGYWIWIYCKTNALENDEEYIQYDAVLAKMFNSKPGLYLKIDNPSISIYKRRKRLHKITEEQHNFLYHEYCELIEFYEAK